MDRRRERLKEPPPWAGIARITAWVSRAGVGVVPLLVPLADDQAPGFDFMDVDRDGCAAGCKAFVRPTTPSDRTVQPAGREGRLGPTLLVTEVAPGIRIRRSIVLG
jgi:hypothetical protein